MDRIVDFEQYCPKCKYRDTDEVMDPCNECLADPVNDDSRKPTRFEEAK